MVTSPYLQVLSPVPVKTTQYGILRHTYMRDQRLSYRLAAG